MEENYKDLIGGIIAQACKDYEEECYRDDVEVFLKGEWFKTITDLDGEKILKELKKRLSEKELKDEEDKKGIERIRKQRGY